MQQKNEVKTVFYYAYKILVPISPYNKNGSTAHTLTKMFERDLDFNFSDISSRLILNFVNKKITCIFNKKECYDFKCQVSFFP